MKPLQQKQLKNPVVLQVNELSHFFPILKGLDPHKNPEVLLDIILFLMNQINEMVYRNQKMSKRFNSDLARIQEEFLRTTKNVSRETLLESPSI